MNAGQTPAEDACPCEKTAQSKITPNPGVVANGETLARMVFSPRDIGGDGRLIAYFVQCGHLTGGGLSVDREEICGEKNIHARAIGGQKERARYAGCARAGAGAVRGIMDAAGKQAFCVSDDAQKNNPAHALVKTSGGQTKGQTRTLRDDLLLLMEKGFAPYSP